MSETEGDTERYKIEIEKLHKKISALREQLEQTKQIIAANETMRLELNQVKKEFENLENIFESPDDSGMRRVIEYIRVMGEGKIIIVFKSGIQIEEEL